MNPENDLITIQTHKEITKLYKSFLELLEDIKNNHKIMLAKSAGQPNADYLKQINYFTEEYYEQLRKRVLDNGNDCARQLSGFLDFFDFTINKEKLANAANQRRITKKVVTNSALVIK